MVLGSGFFFTYRLLKAHYVPETELSIFIYIKNNNGPMKQVLFCPLNG